MGNAAELQAKLKQLSDVIAPLSTPAADRVRNDLAAATFVLSRRAGDKPIVCVVGGTGTGKSTLVNRLVGDEVTATSFRRTFTAGPVAITREPLPSTFALLPHIPADALPAKGQTDRLTVVQTNRPLTDAITLIDTPDVDGELPEHHQLADRVFRWCDIILFLVSPEKYQMPELQPYYRLAQRYALPALFVMNKADEAAVVDDYRQLLARSGVASPEVRAIARDDSTWQPDEDEKLTIDHLAQLHVRPNDAGHRARVADVISRLHDQLLQPLRDIRTQVDRAVNAIALLAGSEFELDVHPLTQQLQRRMRERSVLYLMGPQRILDRVRSVPTMLVRLPKTMWDWTRTGEFKVPGVDETPATEPPDFRQIVVEQFQSLQSRIDDLVRATPALKETSPDWKLDTDRAGAIADEELGELRQWLETRWNATPRDTAVLNKLLKVIPGGQKLGQYSEAAPYLLAIACVTHSAMLGHMDLIVLGGYSAFTWLTQRLSDEVAAKTRATNAAIAERYEQLATEQIERTVSWLQQQAPSPRVLEQITRLTEDIRSEL